GRTVHAPDRVEDPQLVAGADGAVGAAVAVKQRGSRNAERGTAVPTSAFRVPRSFREPRAIGGLEGRLQVVRVHPGPAADRGRHFTDREPVLHYRLARLEVAQGDLVACGDLLAHHDALPCDGHLAGRAQRPNSHRDVVR